jgi:CheY-like chemotaxis protein
MRILVVEDEIRLAELLRRGLGEEGYAVDLAMTGEEALDWANVVSFDVIVRDVMLPGIDGLEVCRRLRRQGIQTPVLLLTARAAGRVVAGPGFEIGRRRLRDSAAGRELINEDHKRDHEQEMDHAANIGDGEAKQPEN